MTVIHGENFVDPDDPPVHNLLLKVISHRQKES